MRSYPRAADRAVTPRSLLAHRFVSVCFLTAIVASLSSTAVTQDPLEGFPNNYKMILDNAKVSVIGVHYGPHERVGLHDHSEFPTLYVYLSDCGPVRFEHKEIPPFTQIRPAVKRGAFLYSPGRLERHTVENLSDQSSDFLRIELKQLRVNAGTAFRGKAPAALAGNSAKKEFISPQLDVERFVCMPGQLCLIPRSESSTLLIAFDDIRIQGSASAAEPVQMHANEVRYFSDSNAMNLSATSQAPAHLLRVTLKLPPHVTSIP